jgi:hypothetical protein
VIGRAGIRPEGARPVKDGEPLCGRKSQ